MTYKEQLKYKLIAEIVDLQSEVFVEAIYELVVNENYDYIRNLMTQEQFEEFIEKWTPNKCCEGEE